MGSPRVGRSAARVLAVVRGGVAGAVAVVAAAMGTLPAAHADEGGWSLPPGGLSLRLQVDHHSDPVAISAIDDDRAPLDPRSGRNLVYLRDEARVAARLTLWPQAEEELAVVWRASGTLVATADALRLKTLVDAKGTPGEGDVFDADGRYVGFKGWGLAFEHRQGSDRRDRDGDAERGWGWTLSAQMLRLTKLRLADVSGQATGSAASALGYLAQAQVTTLDDRTDWPYRRPFDASGSAWLFGGGLGWCAPDWCARLDVEDLGRLRWSGLPRDDFSVSTDVLGTDANGYVSYKRSLIEGRLSQPRSSVTAPWSATARASWRPRSDLELTAAVQHLQDFGALPRVQARWQAGPNWAWLADWRFHERRLGLGVDGRWQALNWRLAAGFDRLDAQARSQSLQALVGWGWN